MALMISFNRSIWSLFAALFTTAFLLGGCDFSRGGDEYFPPATEILRVEVEPNPVAAGDTAIFTCVIEDSLESGIMFKWNFQGLGPIITTDTNQVRWTAPQDSGVYSHQIEVSRRESEFEPVQQPFEVTVVEGN
jgi:hypothetical protein